MEKIVTSLLAFVAFTFLNAQTSTYLYISNSCFTPVDGLYSYDGMVGGKPAYSNGNIDIFWNGSQWVGMDEFGNIGFTNNSTAFYPPCGPNAGWVAGVCNPTGHFSGSTCDVTLTNSCSPSADGTYRYVGDVNGKPSYLRENGNDDFTLLWTGTQWVVEDVNGDYGMTNATNSMLPPCGSSAGWMPGICNPAGNFSGPECYLTLDNSCGDAIEGVYHYVGDVNSRPSYKLTNGTIVINIYWTGSSWIGEDETNAIGFSNTNDTPTPPCGSGWTPGVCSTADFGGTACSTVALPVGLTVFQVSAVDRINKLHWRTASETNNAGFDIERSTDGVRFEKIGFVAGKGTTQQQQDYSFTDASRGGTTYYRLKQLDFDGAFEHSKIISIAQDGKNTVQVSPNPSHGIFSITGIDAVEAEIFTVMNNVGQVVSTTVQRDGQLDMSAFPSGVYYLRVASSGQVVKLVKS